MFWGTSSKDIRAPTPLTKLVVCDYPQTLWPAAGADYLEPASPTSTSTSTSTSALFHKSIGYNRLARKIAIANLGRPDKRKLNWKEKKGKEKEGKTTILSYNK